MHVLQSGELSRCRCRLGPTAMIALACIMSLFASCSGSASSNRIDAHLMAWSVYGAA